MSCSRRSPSASRSRAPSPTWEVTGGSFESAASYAQDAFDDPVVVDRRDRSRWWPRVTLTVTTDPELAATAPPLESLFDPEPKLLDTLEADMEPEMDADKDRELDVYPTEDPTEDQVFEPRHRPTRSTSSRSSRRSSPARSGCARSAPASPSSAAAAPSTAPDQPCSRRVVPAHLGST